MSAIIITKKNDIAWVTLNRVEKHNAFDDEMIASLTQGFSDLAQEPTIKVIILNANGKHFSAGADLTWMKRMKDYDQAANEQDAMKLAKLMSTIYHHPKVVIAAVQGCAFGGGVGLVAACDFAICEKQAKFCFSEVKLGLIPAVISPYVIKAIGQREAKKTFFTAERFSAEKALSYQLVQAIFPFETLQQETENVAQQISRNGPEALKACKKLINDLAPLAVSEEVDKETSKRIASIRVSKEGQEGLNAFFEKRSPNWISQD